MMNKQILILGGGASGLAAAVIASELGASVTVIERSDRVAKKLLATGNGRCNLANTGEPVYFGDADFANQVLSKVGAQAVRAFFERLGVPTRPDSAGRVYPACNQAAAVVDALRLRLQQSGVRIVTGAQATAILPSKDGYTVKTSAGNFAGNKVIVCCGGLAAPKLGAVNAYGLLTQLGCRQVAMGPALTPIETDKAPIKGLSGLRLPVTLTLCEGKKPVAATQGEMLFADYGVSGVCVMQLARDAHCLLLRKAKPMLYVDFSPAMGLGDYRMERLPARNPFANKERMLRYLQEREAFMPENDLLLGALPRILRERLPHLPPEALAELLCAYPLPVTGVRGYDQAQVTQGGIDTRDFSPETLEHKQHKGLYACGEILNVDGDCGGFNLQFAFACGMIAAEHAAVTE
ncbi:MAG: aminoacetone oxidase family FAD-binding enzyme [Clostridia bacterium]|nr:aminoacetone oxidase family FAD-binding enzyme [Clostridia bacterium]